VGKLGSYVLLVFGAAAVAATLYRFGPSREEGAWTWITPDPCSPPSAGCF
jgi:membrane protein